MEYVVEKNISVKSTPEDVWNALTDPEKTRKYFFNCRVLSNWKVGGDIVFKGRMFLIIPIELRGKIVAIEPKRFLNYTLANSSDKKRNSFSTVAITLSFAQGHTNIAVSDFVGTEDGAQKRYERSQKGWEKILNGLKKLLQEDQ